PGRRWCAVDRLLRLRPPRVRRRDRRLARQQEDLDPDGRAVTPHSLTGLAALNVLYLACGACLVWLVRGARDWIDVVRLVGLAYLVGGVLSGSVWTFLLLAPVPVSLRLVVARPALLPGS